tara:strand:+ start:522 stop:1001 length:480 start_codon:yes stop_codon:yes gene_type:complete
MNIGIDFHDTISYAPKFFVNLIKSWKNGDVYIVTGTPPSKIHEIEDALIDLGLTSADFKEILCGYEYDKTNMDLAHFKRMAKHKLALLKKFNIEIYYDDNPFYVSYIKDHDILALQPIMSKAYLQKFEEGDPFFTCNLQKMQFDYLDGLENSTMMKKDD